MVRAPFISAGRTPAKTKAWVVRCCVPGRDGVITQPLLQEEGMFCSTLQHRLISYTVHFWLNYLEFFPHVWYEEGLPEFYDWHHLYRAYQCPRWCVLTCVYELVVYVWVCVCVWVCVLGSDLLPWVHFTYESRLHSYLAAVVSEWILAFHETMLCFVFIQINNNNNINNNGLRSSARILDSFVKFPEKSHLRWWFRYVLA